MVTLFDQLLVLFIIFAMLFSRMPIRAAIAFCAVCSIGLTTIDYYARDWEYFYLAMPIEFAAAVALGIASGFQRKKRDRFFFKAMGMFFMLSFAVTALFTLNPAHSEKEYFSIIPSAILILEHSRYVLISHMVAFTHVAFMLAFSDDIRDLIRNTVYRMFPDRFNHISK